MSYLEVPIFIANDSLFRSWLKDFSTPWEFDWIKHSKQSLNPDSIVFYNQRENKFEYDEIEEIAIQIAKLQEMFPERWSGSLDMKAQGYFEFYSSIEDNIIQTVIFNSSHRGKAGYKFILESIISRDTGKLISRRFNYSQLKMENKLR